MEFSSSVGAKMFIIINYESSSGESGGGYVDDYGNLYVIHGCISRDEHWKEVAEIYKKQIGANELKGFTLLSGPIGPRCR
jgi:hypothetical protein